LSSTTESDRPDEFLSFWKLAWHTEFWASQQKLLACV